MAVLTQFDTMQKIFLTSQKMKNEKQLVWCLQAIHDMVNAKSMEPKLSQRVIKGEGSNEKAIHDMFNAKATKPHGAHLL